MEDEQKKNGALSFSTEGAIMWYAFIKWLVLATLAGLIVGVGASLFVKVLEGTTTASTWLPGNWRLVLLPLGLLFSALFVQRYAPDARGHGTEKVIEAVHENESIINARVVPVKLLATVVTLACGGSAGKEGPAAQIGAALTSLFAQHLKFTSLDRRKFVICGVSAGFAAIFGTPVAGAIFGIEVLFIGQMLYDVLFPSLISGIVAWKVSVLLGMTHPSFDMSGLSELLLSPNTFVWVLLAGAFFGVVSIFFIELMTFFEGKFHRLPLSAGAKAFLGAIVLVLLTLIAGRQYLGLGMDVIDGIFVGAAVPLTAFLWKALFTSITLSCGGSGGVVTPIFFIGSTAGYAFAAFFGLHTQIYGALGMVAVLAGCANTPIAAAVMAMELFGSAMAPLSAIVCASAFLLAGHRSIYPSQRLAFSKSYLIDLEDRVERIDKKPGIAALGKAPMMRHFKHISRRLTGRGQSTENS